MSATGSSPRRSRSQSTYISCGTSPTHRSSKRAFSAATSPRSTGPKEKRARTDYSPSSFPPTTPFKLFDEPSRMPSPLTTLFTNLVSSAPATPLLPSSPSSFFPAVSSSTSHNSSHIQPSFPSPPQQHSRAMLDNLHREAFTSLRHSLAQSGEGFLRRMRDWEERRNAENSKAMIDSQERRGDRRRVRHRGPSHTVNHSIGGMSEIHPRDNVCLFPSADISHAVRLPGHMSGYSTLINPHDDSDIENDMLVDNVGDSLSLTPSERKLHNGSLGTPPVDISNSQELFIVESAETDAYSSAHYASSLEHPFTYSNSRSSSPFSFGNTSDEEFSSGSPYNQPHSGFSSPSVMSNSVDRSSHTLTTRKKLGESIHHSSPCTSPCPSSSGSSCGSLATRHHKSVQSLDNTSTYMHPRIAAVSNTSSQVPQTASDKALAALVLALANGSGSLADYGSVREAQGELKELEAGDLWE